MSNEAVLAPQSLNRGSDTPGKRLDALVTTQESVVIVERLEVVKVDIQSAERLTQRHSA